MPKVSKAKRRYANHPFYSHVMKIIRRYGQINEEVVVKASRDTSEAVVLLMTLEVVKQHHPDNYFKIDMMGSYLKRLETLYAVFYESGPAIQIH